MAHIMRSDEYANTRIQPMSKTFGNVPEQIYNISVKNLNKFEDMGDGEYRIAIPYTINTPSYQTYGGELEEGYDEVYIYIDTKNNVATIDAWWKGENDPTIDTLEWGKFNETEQKKILDALKESIKYTRPR